MIDRLKKLGLTDGEAKVYFAMLKQGPCTVGPLVKESGVAYSNIYEIIDRLMKKGLVTYIVKEKTKYFQVTNIENLKAHLEKRQKELDEQKASLDELLPIINRISKETSQEAEIFTGKKGLRSAYEILLSDAEEKEDFLFFFSSPKEYAAEIDEFYLRMGRRFRESKVNLRGISHETYRSTPAVKQTPWTKMRYVDFPIPSTIDICTDKVMLVAWNRPTGFLIKSQELADNFREYFNALWKQAKN